MGASRSSALSFTPDVHAFSTASCRAEFERELIARAQQLGFDMVSATVVSDIDAGRSRFTTIHNTPAGYLSVFEDPSVNRIDPVMQFCRRHAVPIVWDQSTYVRNSAGSKWETQAAFGYRFGIAMAMHLPNAKHFFLGVDRDQPLPHGEELASLTQAFALLTIYAQVAASRTVERAVPEPATGLTPRELEVLRWTYAGKTAWEVGRVLSISERTAAIHANRAAHKLGCVSKHQAAIKALHLGLI